MTKPTIRRYSSSMHLLLYSPGRRPVISTFICLCRCHFVVLSSVQSLSHRRDAIVRKDNHHDHTTRHNAPVHTCILTLWVNLIAHAVCAAVMCRDVWSWRLSFRVIAESTSLQFHCPSALTWITPHDTDCTWDWKWEFHFQHEHRPLNCHPRPRSDRLSPYPSLLTLFFLSVSHCLSSSQFVVFWASISRSSSILCTYMCSSRCKICQSLQSTRSYVRGLLFLCVVCDHTHHPTIRSIYLSPHLIVHSPPFWPVGHHGGGNARDVQS